MSGQEIRLLIIHTCTNKECDNTYTDFIFEKTFQIKTRICTECLRQMATEYQKPEKEKIKVDHTTE